MTDPFYRAGTVTLTNADAVVVGLGTSFLSNVRPGDLLVLADASAVVVLSVETGVGLTLAEPWAGATVTTGDYAILRTGPSWSSTVQLSADIQTLLEQIRDGGPSGIDTITAVGGTWIVTLNDGSQIDAGPATYGHTHPSTDIVGLADALAAKQNAADYTAADVLAKLLTVHGSGSGINADMLDGEAGAHYLAWENLTGVPASFPATPHAHSVADVVDFPATMPPTAHAHTTADVSGFAEAVDDRVGALLFAGTNIALAYDDALGRLTISAAFPPAGPSGAFTPRGEYDDGTAYVANDLVSFGGASYVATKATTGNAPPDPLNWQLNSSAAPTAVSGPGLSIDGGLAQFADESGVVLEDSGFTVTQLRDRANHTGTIPAVGGVAFTGTNKLVGRASAGAGVGEEITCTAVARTFLAAGTVANQRAALSTGGLATAQSWTATQTFQGLTPAIFKYTANDAGAGPLVNITRESTSPAASDFLGSLRYMGSNSDLLELLYASLYANIIDPTAGTEDGRLTVQTRINGVLDARAYVQSGFVVGLPTGADKGVGTVNAQNGLFHGGVAVPRVLTASVALGAMAVPANSTNTSFQISCPGAAIGDAVKVVKYDAFGGGIAPTVIIADVMDVDTVQVTLSRAGIATSANHAAGTWKAYVFKA